MNSVTNGNVLPQRARRPLELYFIQIVSLLLGCMWVFNALRIITNPDQVLPGETTPSMMADVLYLTAFLGVVGACLLAIAFGIWRERKWVRPLAVALPAATWLVQVVSSFAFGRSEVVEYILATVVYGVCVLVAWGIVYQIPSVRNYYSSLNR